MQVSVQREPFYRIIARVQSIVERKSNMPILSTVLVETGGDRVQVSATDLEIGYQESMPAVVEREGSVTINGRKLFEILKESRSQDFQMTGKDNDRVVMTDGVARFELACHPVEQYPAFSIPDGLPLCEIPGLDLSRMISKTIYAVSSDEMGSKLTGIFAEKVTVGDLACLRMVSTDGHRLSLMERPLACLEELDLGSGVLIPRKGMAELVKLCVEEGAIRLGFGEKTCVARAGEAVLMMRLLDAKFPEYRAAIPENCPSTVTLSRLGLLEAMRKMLILSSVHYRAVRVVLNGDFVELLSTNPEIGEGEEKIAVTYGGDRLEFRFNPRYFVDVLQSMESASVTLGFIDGSKPCVVRGDGDQGFVGLIMPMRV